MGQLEKNKAIVGDFIDITVNQKDPRRAADLYMADGYIQHEHGAGDGKESFVELLSGMVGQMPEGRLTIKRMIAEDDLVAVHFHMKPAPDHPGMAAVDILRLADDRIVEHWTVMAPVPTEGEPVNANGIF
jgi:predicted SnoaL-like aldol condensation-catalyzing enzyme